MVRVPATRRHRGAALSRSRPRAQRNHASDRRRGELAGRRGRPPPRPLMKAMMLQSRFGTITHMTTYDPSAAAGDDVPPLYWSEVSERSAVSKKGASSASAPSVRTIRNMGSFSEEYDMGKEVMPSTHSYMKVHFATRKSDKQEVVVKVRNKPQCFRSREEERSWRHNTDFLLNLPETCGVARLYDVIEDSKAFYVVMEKVSGLDLFETFERGRVDINQAKDILRQLLVSLMHLHSRNAVHKDLKLENVMLDRSARDAPPQDSLVSEEVERVGAIKIIDFDTLEEWTPGAPISKDVLGTDQYIAQEAYAGRYSPLSDVFAVGVIVFRLLTGRFPFHDGMFDDEPGENWVGCPKMGQIRRRLKVAKVDFSHSSFQQNPEALDLLKRMLAYDAEDRPSAMAALEHPWMRGDAAGGFDGEWEFGCARDAAESLIDDGIIIAD